MEGHSSMSVHGFHSFSAELSCSRLRRSLIQALGIQPRPSGETADISE
jgi:hypothetical protein